MIETLKAISHIWAWLAAGGLVFVGLLAAAWLLPPLRQLFLGLAGGALLATWSFGHGAYLEHKVCVAREHQAELAAARRDAYEARVARDDARRRSADLEQQAQQDKERINAYAKRLAKRPVCRLRSDDLR